MAYDVSKILREVNEGQFEHDEPPIALEQTDGQAHSFIRFMDRHKKLLLVVFSTFIVAIVGIIGIFNYYTAYEYSYNNRVLGVVKDKEDVLRITGLVQSALTQENDIQVVINKKNDIDFKRVPAMGDVHIDTSEEVLKRLTYMGDINVKAYAITIDGKRIGAVESKAMAEDVLNDIKKEFISKDKNAVLEDAKFIQNVAIKEINTGLGKLNKPKEVKKQLASGAKVERTHIVSAGETLADLAKEYGMTEKEVLNINPDANPEQLRVGSEIVLEESAPLVTLQTSELVTYEEPIDYEIREEKSDQVYEGETKVKVKGVKGVKEVTARVVKNNGKESTKLPLVSKTEKEPVARVVLVGTKEKPPTMGTKTYIYPVKGFRISSPFGPRWGRNHNGLDLACDTGTDIVAADGGTVEFSGYKGSFGYVIIIDHQNGHESYYAHCSKLIAKKGDKVYRGKLIAKVGSTGRSTGPHCHFEVDVKGKPTDPTPFIVDE